MNKAIFLTTTVIVFLATFATNAYALGGWAQIRNDQRMGEFRAVVKADRLELTIASIARLTPEQTANLDLDPDAMVESNLDAFVNMEYHQCSSDSICDLRKTLKTEHGEFAMVDKATNSYSLWSASPYQDFFITTSDNTPQGDVTLVVQGVPTIRMRFANKIGEAVLRVERMDDSNLMKITSVESGWTLRGGEVGYSAEGRGQEVQITVVDGISVLTNISK